MILVALNEPGKEKLGELHIIMAVTNDHLYLNQEDREAVLWKLREICNQT